VGRYKSPDEHPFFPDGLPEPVLPPLQYPQVNDIPYVHFDRTMFSGR